MVHANDLMCGNLLFDANGVLITVDARTIFDIWNSSKEYKPIPLTAEWMHRAVDAVPNLGFYENEDWFMLPCIEVAFYQDIQKELSTPFRPLPVLPVRVYVVDISKGSNGFVPFEIQYVHELQNLFYIKTKQQLKFKHT